MTKTIRYLRIIGPYILILISGVLTYKGIIFSSGPACQEHDIEVLSFPQYYFVRKAFIGGEFPFWDPYVMLGQSCVPLFVSGTFYPFLLGFLSMGFLGHLMPRHMELFLVAHFLFSGITMYWGARKLGLNKIGSCLAGIVFQMAITIKSTIIGTTCVYAMPWIPLAVGFGGVLLRSSESAFCRRNIFSFLIAVMALTFIVSIGYPLIIVHVFLTLWLMACFYIIYNFRIFKNIIYISIFPVLLCSVTLIPYYNLLHKTVRYKAGDIENAMALLTPHIWTLLFPGFGNSIQAPLAYAGVITILLAFYFCITTSRDKGKEETRGFLFVILAVFWFYYSVYNSLLFKALHYVPILSNIRVSQYGLIMYVFFISILAGKGVERLLRFREFKIGFNLNLLFPVFIIFMLFLSLPSFLGMTKNGFPAGSRIALYFGLIFLLYLIFQKFVKAEKIRIFLLYLVPSLVILEISMSSPPFINRSNAGAFTPYTYKLDKFTSDFPECFLKKDLFRMDSFYEYIMAEYYFNRLGAFGSHAGGLQSPRYYYLWDEHGKPALDFHKWYVGSNLEKYVKPIPLDSRLYDLAGVKYLYLPEYEWLFIDYKKSGQGEWVEAELFDRTLVNGIGIYNPPGPLQRRMLKATLVLNDKDKILMDILNEEGWHKFYFEPTVLQKIRIIADEVTPFDTYDGTRGVVIGEIELLDKKGNKIDTPIKDFSASSTMKVSNPSMIMDNRPGHVWESRCSVLAGKTIPNENLERLREGCYINKDVLPRAFMVYKARFVKDKHELLQELHSVDFQPGEEVLLEGEPVRFDIPEGPYTDNVEILSYKINSVEISVENNKPGFLVLTDMYDSGWEVFINGVKDHLFIADGLFRGVFIEGGRHKVLFRYSLPFLKLGLFVSLFTIISLVCIIIIYNKKNFTTEAQRHKVHKVLLFFFVLFVSA